MNELATQHELATDLAGQTTLVSWSAPAHMTFDEWERVGRTLQTLGKSLNFWLGDWLVHGEMRWGEMYSQALEITGLAPETLSKYKGVSARVPAELRREDLSWSHHFAVAYAPEEVRGPMLELAARFALSSRDLKEIMRLRPEQLYALIEACEGREEMTPSEFSRTLNHIRLNMPATATINGNLALGHTDEEEEEEEEEGLAPAALGEEEGEGTLPGPVYVEELFAFFDRSGTPLAHCLADEAAWPGLRVRAALDKQGKPILVWEKGEEA